MHLKNLVSVKAILFVALFLSCWDDVKATCIARLDPIEVTMAKSRALCFLYCADDDKCGSITYKDYDQYIEDSMTESGNAYEGNCLLHSIHGDYLVREESDHTDYSVCRRGEVDSGSTLPVVCMENAMHNVTTAATDAGFGIKVHVSSLESTMFFKTIEEEVPYSDMAWRCAEAGGILPQIDDDGIRQALIDQDVVDFPIRIGMQVTIDNDGETRRISWMLPLRLLWKSTEAGTCDLFSSWDDFDEDTVHMDVEGNYVPGPFSGSSNKLTCQFPGKVISQGKDVFSYYAENPASPRSLVTDGIWNDQSPFRPSQDTAANWVFLAVDLERDYIITSIGFKGDTDVVMQDDWRRVQPFVSKTLPDVGVGIKSDEPGYGVRVCCDIFTWYGEVRYCNCGNRVKRFAGLMNMKNYAVYEIVVVGLEYK